MKEFILNKIVLKILFRIITLIIFIVTKLQTFCAFVGLAFNLISIGKTQRIFVVSFPKSGTTWLEMVMYQLTTDGDLNKISHLMDAVPFLETQLNPINLLPAKIIKTHLPHKWFWMLRKKGKFLYITRDGLDVAVSYYHHYCNYLDYTGSFNEFYESHFLNLKAQDGSWFRHISGWMKEKDNPNVLFLRYEDMKKDLESIIRKIIKFCELDVKEKDMPRILERCSFEYMKQHEDKVDFASHFNAQLSHTKKKVGNFIRKGGSGYRDGYRESDLIAYQKLFSKYLGSMGFDLYSKADEI